VIKKIALILGHALTAIPYRRFIRHCYNPRKSQDKFFNKVLSHLKLSKYGEGKKVESLADYQRLIPIIKYEDIQNEVDLIFQGERNILFPGKAKFLEKTSGSSGRYKLIPYNKKILKAFSNMFAVWSHDLMKYGPKLSGGKFYFSISPQFQLKEHASVGLEDDSSYIEGPIGKITSFFFLKIPGVDKVRDPEVFKSLLYSSLMNCHDLEVISIWSPTFLTALFDHFDKKDCVNSNVKIVSCWGHGMASEHVNKLKVYFPNAFIQYKGLLATEAPLTIPLIKANGYLPLIDDVLFEFLPLAAPESRALLIDEIETGKEYIIIISQLAGLYRYRLGDIIRVSHFFKKTPCLEFVRREGDIVDMAGEKLTEDFVKKSMEEVIDGDQSAFLIADANHKDGFRYILCTDNAVITNKKIDQILSTSYHYYNARSLGQLKMPEVIRLKNPREWQQLYFSRVKGQKLGDIKDRWLLTETLQQVESQNYHLSDEYQ
jgi:hypothetical protein